MDDGNVDDNNEFSPRSLAYERFQAEQIYNKFGLEGNPRHELQTQSKDSLERAIKETPKTPKPSQKAFEIRERYRTLRKDADEMRINVDNPLEDTEAKRLAFKDIMNWPGLAANPSNLVVGKAYQRAYQSGS
tara:strand:+ start:401 stop:796 length:396 start_codon:yes stop_codon:yes gene_type:complete